MNAEAAVRSIARTTTLLICLVLSIASSAAREVPIIFDDFLVIHRYSVSGVVDSTTGPLPFAINLSAAGATKAVAIGESYVFDFEAPGNYTITPGSPLETCAFAPASRTVSLGADATGANFSATCPTFSIGGLVAAGIIPAGVLVRINGVNYPVAANGTYAAAGLYEGVYDVSVVLPAGAECTVSPASIQVSLTASASINFTLACSTYQLAGTLSGTMPADGAVSINGATYQLTAGYYSATLLAGTYTVAPQFPPQYGCVANPPSRQVTLGPSQGSADFAIQCPTYDIGGSVSAGVMPSNMVIGVASRQIPVQLNGSYLGTGFFAGNYSLVPARAGCVFSPTNIDVVVGPSSVANNFSATCSVAVSGNAGEPGVTISIGSKTAVSQSDNTYLVAGLTPGSYIVTPTKADCTFTPTSRSLAVGTDDIGQINFSASCTYRISGLLGTRQASVSASGQPAVVSDVAGAYAFVGLSRGTYTVVPSKPGCAFVPTSQSLAVGPNSISNANFTSTCAHSITGNAGIVGALITAGSRSATSGSEGAYVLTGVAEGQIALVAARQGCTFQPQNVSIQFYTDEVGRDFAATCGSGAYVLSGNTGQAGAVVKAVAGTNTYVAIANSQGVYSFPRLPQGTFTLTASKTGCQASPSQKAVDLGPNRTEDFVFYCPPLPSSPQPTATLSTDVLRSMRKVTGGASGYQYVYEVDMANVAKVAANAQDPFWWRYYRSFFDAQGNYNGSGTGPYMNSGSAWNAGPSLSTFISDWVTQAWNTVNSQGYTKTNPTFSASTLFSTRDAIPVPYSGGTGTQRVYLQHHIRGKVGTWIPTMTSLGPGYFDASAPSTEVTLNFKVQLYKRTVFETQGSSTYDAWDYVMPGEVKPSGWALVPLDPWIVKDGRGVQWVIVKPASAPLPYVRESSSSPPGSCPIPGVVGEYPVANQNPCIIDPKLWLPLQQVNVVNGVCQQLDGSPFPGLSDAACSIFPSGTYDTEALLFKFASLELAFGGNAQPDWNLAGKIYRVGVDGSRVELTLAQAVSELRASGTLFMNGSMNSLAAATENAKVLVGIRGEAVVLIYMAQDIAYPQSQGTYQADEIAVLRQLLTETADVKIQAVGHSWSSHIILAETRGYANVSTVLVNAAQVPFSTILDDFMNDVRNATGTVCIVAGVADALSTFGGGQFDPTSVPCGWNGACKLQSAVAANSTRVSQTLVGDLQTNPVGHGFIDVATRGGAGAMLCN